MQRAAFVSLGAALLVSAVITSPALGAWVGPPTTISVTSDDGLVPAGAAQAPAIAIDAAGVVTAVWEQWVGDFRDVRIRAARFVDGAWGAPVPLSATGADAGSAAVATDAEGNVTVAWLRPPGMGASVVQAARFTSGGWSAPVTLWSAPGRRGTAPAVAAVGSGTAVVAWGSCPASGPGDCSVGFTRFAAGAWAPASDLTAGPGSHTPGVIRAGAPGEAAAWWWAPGHIVTATWTTAGGWAGPSSVGSGVNTPSLAMNASGQGVLTWMEADAVMVAMRVGEAWGVAEAISPGDVSPRRPVAAIDAAGTVTVAWQGSPAVGGGPVTVAARRRVGGAWDPVATVSGDDHGLFNPRPEITVGALGAVTVTWVGTLPTGREVVRAAHAVNGAWGAPVTILAPASGAVGVPSQAVATDPLGRVMAVWEESRGGTSSVKAVRMQGVPGAPTGAAATAGEASAEVSWTAPRDDGSAAITGYRVTATPGGHTCTTATTACRVAGLSGGTAYALTVAAVNGIGTGPESAPTAQVIPTVAPPVVRSLKTTIRLSRRVLTTTGLAATGVTRVNQRLTAKGRKARSGMCRILRAAKRGSPRTFRCRARLTPARWTVRTQTRDARGVLARSTRAVRVR